MSSDCPPALGAYAGGVIDREIVDGVAVVRLAAGKVNALDLELCRAVTETFRELDAGDVRAVVLTGAGRAFSAGVDLWRIVEGGEAYVRDFLAALVDCFEAVFGCGKPVVAAVNGHAIAGGCVLACCCDHRVMSQGRIGLTELAVGVPFPVTALEIMRYAAGPARARAAVLGAWTFEPAAAVRAGLVDEAVEEAVERAVEVAAGLGRIPADTYRFSKRQLQAPVWEQLERRRPAEDPGTAELWSARVADGTIRAYMEEVTAR
jgi:enoyl-CoA hydratase/carnithine racemase